MSAISVCISMFVHPLCCYKKGGWLINAPVLNRNNKYQDLFAVGMGSCKYTDNYFHSHFNFT